MAELRARRDRGFTLIEMIVAMAILVFGATALIGALGLGVSTRRTAEMRGRAVLLVDQIVFRVENEVLPEHPLPERWDSAADLAIPAVRFDDIDGYRGLAANVEFTVDEERPELVLVSIRVAWREQGEEVGEVFKRVLARDVPIAKRVTDRGRR